MGPEIKKEKTINVGGDINLVIGPDLEQKLPLWLASLARNDQTSAEALKKIGRHPAWKSQLK